MRKKTALRRSFCSTDRGHISGRDERPRPPIWLPGLPIIYAELGSAVESKDLFNGRNRESVAQTTQERRLKIFKLFKMRETERSRCFGVILLFALN
jgi:hypothetical protein